MEQNYYNEYTTLESIPEDVMSVIKEYFGEKADEYLENYGFELLFSDFITDGQRTEVVESDYIYHTYSLVVDKYRFEATSSSYRKDQLICDPDWGAFRVYDVEAEKVYKAAETKRKADETKSVSEQKWNHIFNTYTDIELLKLELLTYKFPTKIK